MIELGRRGARRRAAPPPPGTLAYTSYLLSTAYGAGPLEIMTAIMPCAWSYGEIAARLRAEIRPHPVYSSWVGFFDSDEYRALLADMRAQLDAMGRDADPAPPWQTPRDLRHERAPRARVLGHELRDDPVAGPAHSVGAAAR